MKNRQPLRLARVAAGLPVALCLAAGCGGTANNGTPDLSTPAVTLTLKNVPTGCPTTETAADLYTTVVSTSCALNGCHGQNSTSFHLLSATDLHDQWVGKRSNLYAGVTQPFVTAGDVNASWVMYKLTGSQGQFGSQMPSTGSKLTDAQVCKFVAWISSGAN